MKNLRWYPRSFELQLLYVPDAERKGIRRLLAPALRRMTKELRVVVQAQHCWQIAQALTMAANSERVQYVEGVWSRPWELEAGEPPAPHAWNLVDGHRVDLVEELFVRDIPDDNEWLYEVLKVYPVHELKDDLRVLLALSESANGRDTFAGGESISIPFDSNDDLLPERLHDCNKPNEADVLEAWENVRWGMVFDTIFKPAIDGMIRKYAAAVGEPS